MCSSDLVWEIPGFCYLECVNLALERRHYWPANPTVYTFANFGDKYRKSVNFCLIETIPGKHFNVKTFPEGDSRLAWKRIEFLAKTDKSFMRVGGDVDSTFKPLDGTNYSDSKNCPNVWHFWIVCDIASYAD